MSDWVQRLNLAPHPEGGWFRRIYTATAASSIHYLLDRASPVGHLHRNGSTILHYLQDGGPVEYSLLNADGVLRRVVLGQANGEEVFLHVPGGVWKASRLAADASHALVSEVVLPAWQAEDHEFMSREQLLRDFPQHQARLLAFIR